MLPHNNPRMNTTSTSLHDTSAALYKTALFDSFSSSPSSPPPTFTPHLNRRRNAQLVDDVSISVRLPAWSARKASSLDAMRMEAVLRAQREFSFRPEINEDPREDESVFERLYARAKRPEVVEARKKLGEEAEGGKGEQLYEVWLRKKERRGKEERRMEREEEELRRFKSPIKRTNEKAGEYWRKKITHVFEANEDYDYVQRSMPDARAVVECLGLYRYREDERESELVSKRNKLEHVLQRDCAADGGKRISTDAILKLISLVAQIDSADRSMDAINGQGKCKFSSTLIHEFYSMIHTPTLPMHEPEPKSAPSPKVRVATMLQKFQAQEQRRLAKIKRAQADKDANESKECTFKPLISPSPLASRREAAAGSPGGIPIYARLHSLAQRQKVNMEIKQKELVATRAAKEVEGCTFSPSRRMAARKDLSFSNLNGSFTQPNVQSSSSMFASPEPSMSRLPLTSSVTAAAAPGSTTSSVEVGGASCHIERQRSARKTKIQFEERHEALGQRSGWTPPPPGFGRQSAEKDRDRLENALFFDVIVADDERVTIKARVGDDVSTIVKNFAREHRLDKIRSTSLETALREALRLSASVLNENPPQFVQYSAKGRLERWFDPPTGRYYEFDPVSGQAEWL